MDNRSYYTTNELKESAYIQFPKWLMFGPEFCEMSPQAKLLYVNLLDINKLSIKNNWADDKGNAYVICKRESMQKLLNCSEKTARKYFKELVDFHLLIDVQRGMNKPNLIYLMKPSIFNYEDPDLADESEISYENDEKIVKKADEYWTGKIYQSGPVNNTGHDRELLPPNKNNISKNNISNKNLDSNESINSTYLFEDEEDELIQIADGLFVNQEQYDDVNQLIRAIGKHEINATKKSLLNYLYILQERGWLDSEGKVITNLFGYVKSNFDIKHKDQEEEYRILSKLADDGNDYAQDAVSKMSRYMKLAD